MHIPAHFRSDELAAQHALMRAQPFALLATVHDGGLALTHLPVRLDAARGALGTLEAHLARVNPHAAALAAGAPSTVVFAGPHGYVSPRWYADPAHNVPTWNYLAVHAHGRPRVVDDPAAVLAMLGRLTDQHEAGSARPWRVAEAQAYAGPLVRGIVAFEIAIERIEGQAKLSQNRSAADRVGVLAALARDPAQAGLLEAMRALYDADGALR